VFVGYELPASFCMQSFSLTGQEASEGGIETMLPEILNKRVPTKIKRQHYNLQTDRIAVRPPWPGQAQRSRRLWTRPDLRIGDSVNFEGKKVLHFYMQSTLRLTSEVSPA